MLARQALKSSEAICPDATNCLHTCLAAASLDIAHCTKLTWLGSAHCAHHGLPLLQDAYKQCTGAEGVLSDEADVDHKPKDFAAADCRMQLRRRASCQLCLDYKQQ